jgi:hypothetical protein
MRRPNVLWWLLAQAAFAAEPVTLDDVKTLASQGAYAELLEKAERVKPSERTAEWTRAVTRAAAEACDEKPATGNPLSQVECIGALAKRFAFLKADAAFQKRVETLVVEGVDDCKVRGFDDCDLRVMRMSNQLKSETLMAAAKALIAGGYLKTAPMPLIADAVKQNAALCADKTVSDVTLASLELPADSPRAQQAKSLAFGVCYAKLSAALKQAMVGPSDYLLKNACAGLKEKKALSELQADLCHDVGL